jgi:hypothetical protein
MKKSDFIKMIGELREAKESFVKKNYGEARETLIWLAKDIQATIDLMKVLDESQAERRK